uniref:acetylcholinesterase n=1 Tax=Globodera rostochiensis TaxID=31243 RepID=A0A914GVT7_GLORO
MSKKAPFLSTFVSSLLLLLFIIFVHITENFASLSSTHQSNVPVEIELVNGHLRGIESIFLHKRVRSFLGVPFAEPPVGELRFRPPQPKRSWNGTVEAITLSPACYQGRDTYNDSFWGSEMWNANTPISEDCLYMNIWAPAEAKNLTVMVWFFGGGFYYGSPSLILYDGKALSLEANVIVVNINYRLGPFGYLFLDNEAVPGNMGMLDQQLALHWIRDNIAAFGGDPKMVTIFGESAGASSIVAHLIAPNSQGLFKNGILQSGSLDNKWSMDTPRRAYEKSIELVRLVGCNRTGLADAIRCLRRIPPAEFTEQLWNIPLNFLEFPLVIVSRDANFFSAEDAFIALRKRHYAQDVNLMIGINHDEGTFWNIYNIPKFFDVSHQPKLSLENFNECVQTAFSRLPDIVREAASHVYLGTRRCEYETGFHQNLADQVNQMVGDYFFTCDSIWLADQLDNAPARVYIYYFDQTSSANPWPKWTGVMHGYEIEYVFGVPIYNGTAGYTQRERTLSEKMVQLWSSFATTGIPSLDHRDGMPERLHWPQYHSQNNPRWLELKASHIKPTRTTKKHECRIWRAARDMEYNEYAVEKLTAALTASVVQTRQLLLLNQLIAMLLKALCILLCFVVIFGCLNAAPNKQKQLLNSPPSSLSSAESEQFNHHDKGHHKNRGVVKQNVENKNIKKMENEHIGTSNRQSVMQTNHQTERRAEQQRRPTERSASRPTERSASRPAERQRPTTQRSANRPVESRHPANAERSGASRPIEQKRKTTQRHKNHQAERRHPTEETDNCPICFESLLGPDAGGLKKLQKCTEHSFHQECIDEWLKNIKNDSCPVCRKKVSKEELPAKRFDPDQVQRNENLNVIDELPLEIVLEILQEQEAGGALPLQIPSQIVEAIQREHRNNLPSTSNAPIQREHRNNLPSTSNAVSTRNEEWEPYEHLLNAVSTRNDEWESHDDLINDEWESYEHMLNEQSGQQTHGQNDQTASAVDLAKNIAVTTGRVLARGLTMLGNSLNDWLDGDENFAQQASTSQTADGIMAYHDNIFCFY